MSTYEDLRDEARAEEVHECRHCGDMATHPGRCRCGGWRNRVEEE